MVFYLACLLIIKGVLSVPIENDAIIVPSDPIEIFEVLSDSGRLIERPRTLNFDKLHKLNPIYWFSDEDGISERITKLEKRQRVMYNLMICGNPSLDKCKKLAKLAAKLFKKKGDDDDDKPEPKPENKPNKPEEKPGKPTENPAKPENSEEKPATSEEEKPKPENLTKPEENETTTTAVPATTVTGGSTTASNEVSTTP